MLKTVWTMMLDCVKNGSNLLALVLQYKLQKRYFDQEILGCDKKTPSGAVRVESYKTIYERPSIWKQKKSGVIFLS